MEKNAVESAADSSFMNCFPFLHTYILISFFVWRVGGLNERDIHFQLILKCASNNFQRANVPVIVLPFAAVYKQRW